MRKSIRARIAITFIILTALVLLAIGVFQYAFLDRYYFSNKQKTLIISLERIREKEYGASVPESFEQFCSVNGLTPNPVRAKHNFKTYITNATDEVCSRVEIFNTICAESNPLE